jgi:phage terminase large subunit
MKEIELLEWQKDYISNKSPVIIAASGKGTGKSWAGLLKLHLFCLKNPNAFCVLVRKTRSSLLNSNLPVLEEFVGFDNPFVKHNKFESAFKYTNGSRLFYSGFNDPASYEKLYSLSIDLALMEEATEFDFSQYEHIKAGMRGTAADFRQIILNCNPRSSSHWIYQETILKQIGKLYKPLPDVNTFLPESYLNDLKSLSGTKKQRLYDGMWVSDTGSVHPFDFAKHVVEPIPREQQKGWEYRVVIDIGYKAPTVVHLWGKNEEDIAYLIKEHYQSQLSPDGLVEVLDDICEDYPIREFICDHDAQVRAHLAQNGYPTILAKKDIDGGIEKVNARFERDEIFFFENCQQYVDKELRKKHKPTSIFEEFGSFVWIKVKKNRKTVEIPSPDDDHSMNTLRYYVEAIDKFMGLSSVNLADYLTNF